MVKEIKYFIFLLVIIIYIFFSIKYYISDENKKKTFRNLSSIDKNITLLKSKLVIIHNDTDNIIKYLNNDKIKNQKKHTFWELLKSEN
tara:strand:- start:2836 stop:3099 length:264 start_codon:yes stop_codon:yes gene_type:complete